MGSHSHGRKQLIRHVRGHAIAERSGPVGIAVEDGLDLRSRDAGRTEAIEELAEREVATMLLVDPEQDTTLGALTPEETDVFRTVSASHVASPAAVA